MKCQFAFLDVGNADSIIVTHEASPSIKSAIVIDIPNARVVTDWLKKEKVSVIDCVFFTHDHRDHLPSLPSFVKFVTDWLKSNTIDTVCLPTETIRNSFQQLKPYDPSNVKQQRLRHAMEQLSLWDKGKGKNLNIRRVERGTSPFVYGSLKVEVLHPSYIFVEHHFNTNPVQVNETSLVLRIEYGKFVAILLADIEGKGLTELLTNFNNLPALKAHLVKIPHHGGWPSNSNELEELLRKIDAELAVISVGSQNKHGHVVPELFELLLNLQRSTSQVLRKFLCTELTRTCVKSVSERSAMGKSGLDKRQACGGNIVIIADTSGDWEIENQVAHSKLIQTFSRAACLDKAELK